MVNGIFILSVLLAISFILVGALTLLRDPKSRLNRYFMLFSGSLAIWLIANYLAGSSNTVYGTALISNRLTFLFIGISTLTILLFVRSLVRAKQSKFYTLFYCFSLFAIILGSTQYVVNDVEVKDSTYVIKFGILAVYYFSAVTMNSLLAISELFRGRKKAIGAQKAQIYVIQMSFAVGIIGIIITNALIPLVFNYYAITSLGSFFSAFFVFGISYAIVKHKLFDIRLVVARSLAYVLLLATLAGIYGLVVFGVADLVFKDSAFSERIVPVLTALLLAFTSPYLRHLFDKLTNRLFYRDAYEPQVFLDELNKQLVSNIDIEALLEKCSSIIVLNMKAEFALFGLKETAYSGQRLIGNKQKKFDDEDIAAMRSLSPQMKQIAVVSDELDEDDRIKKMLVKYDIAVLARLTSDVTREVEGLGYLLLGQKKSGNPYNKQDIKIIEIIANELVIAIQNALRFEEIEKFNITLQEKVDEATKELRRTNEKLKQLDETKDEFISMASHQLRTPLTSVKGYLSMVIEGDAGEVAPMQKKLLDQAFVSSQRMVYLIADLLNVSRLRTGKFIIEPVQSNLADVVESEISQLVETAAGRGLELTFTKPENFPALYLDETKIRQVVMNFIDNAIYYTPKGGHIEVRLEDKGESIELTVNDNGMGVPRTEQPHLFTKFYRAANAQKARPDGTGLGLFMAKKVVIAQGGSIIFRSEEGKGSTFGFTFPKSKLQPPVQAAAEATTDNK